MDILPSTPSQIRQWIVRNPASLEPSNDFGCPVITHAIRQSCAQGRSAASRDRNAVKAVRLLLDAGARVDEPIGCQEAHPLFESCFRKIPDTTSLLLDHGAHLLKTRSGPHERLYAAMQALESFGWSLVLNNPKVYSIMDRLFDGEVIQRMNFELNSGQYGLLLHIMGEISPYHAQKRLSFFIGRGLADNPGWDELLPDMGLDPQWAREEVARFSQARMEAKTPCPAQSNPSATPRF